MCYEAAIALSRGDDTTLAKSFIISLMGSIERKVLYQFPWFPSGAQHRRELPVMPAV
jgi:hypothetical protein